MLSEWFILISCNTNNVQNASPNSAYSSTAKTDIFIRSVAAPVTKNAALEAFCRHNHFWSAQVILRIIFYLQNNQGILLWSSKATHINSWLTWRGQRSWKISAQKRWKAPIQHEWKDKMGKNVTRNSRLRSHYFNKEKIRTDSYMTDDPAQ